MFGLVRRQRLLDCERSRVDLKVEKIRLEGQLADAEDTVRSLDGRLQLAQQRVTILEADRERLLSALAARTAPADAVPAEEETPQPRSLSFLEVATRATAHRNRHNAAAAGPAALTVIQTAAAEAHQRRTKNAATHAPRKEDL